MPTETQERIARRKAQGRCIRCPQPAAPGKSRCPECLKKASRDTLARRILRVRQGLCHKCGQPLEHYPDRCDACMEKHRAFVRQKKGHRPWQPGRPGRPPRNAVAGTTDA